jgi:MinD-like ATPase involved in chromosome partitioning or flagellar assembly
MSQIISVHSFRGGTGKSNMTANLATTLALQGKRIAIIDTDIQSPGIHVIFGLNEQKMNYCLNDYLWGKCAIEDTAYDVTHLLQGEGGSGKIYLIPSSINPGQITRILREGYDVARLNDGFYEIIDALDLDYLLIDTHPGLNEETLLSIAISDILVVILRPDQQDFQGTAVTLEVARKLEVPKMMLVVNKVLSTFDFNALQQEVESTYKTPVAGIVPLSEDIIRLASSNIFCLLYPKHPFSQVVQKITAQIIREQAKVAVRGAI